MKMYKLLFILLTVVILSAASIPVKANDINIGNGMSLGYESCPDNSSEKNNMDKLAKPYDDVKISDGISAGIISKRDKNVMYNKHRDQAEDKGTDVGVGLSLSF